MIRIAIKIAGLALLNMFLLWVIWNVMRYFTEWPRGMSYGIGMYYIWIFLSIQGLISLIMMHFLSLKISAVSSAAMIIGIFGFFYPCHIFWPYIAMISVGTLFCAVVFTIEGRRS